jgi:hypothetical protein
MVISFKSTNENFIKEKSGVKNNTFRKVDLDDNRFIQLLDMTAPFNGYIKIINADFINRSFERKITDIIFYDGYVIITWEHEE